MAASVGGIEFDAKLQSARRSGGLHPGHAEKTDVHGSITPLQTRMALRKETGRQRL